MLLITGNIDSKPTTARQPVSAAGQAIHALACRAHRLALAAREARQNGDATRADRWDALALKARWRVAWTFRGMIWKLAHRVVDRGDRRRIVEPGDLVGAALIQTVATLESFDPEKALVTTYLGRSIGLYMLRVCRNLGMMIRVSSPMYDCLAPGIEYIDGSPELAASLASDDVGPAEVAEAAEQRAIALQFLAILPDRMRYVIRRRFGLDGEEPALLEEIGHELQLTRERVRQIERMALERMCRKAGTDAAPRRFRGSSHTSSVRT